VKPLRRPRRWFCAALGAAAVLPWRAGAQPRKARIGFLGGGFGLSDAGNHRYAFAPFLQGLRELGYVDGQNLVIDWRFAEGRLERLPGLVAELLALSPDVLVTSAPRPAQVAKEATRTVPIVAIAVDDPVLTGLAATHARPGGNITGLSGAFHGILSRRMRLLKDVLPDASRFAILVNTDSYPLAGVERDAAEPARAVGVTLQMVGARVPAEFDAAFAAMARERADGVLVLADPVYYVHRIRLGELCLRHRLPSVFGGGGYLEGGGLLSFQGDWPSMYRRAGSFIDKILKGTPPGEIPFEQSTKFEVVVNLKAAKALGLKLPQSVLVSADEVIE
jgi:putative ABC transport system substrate-binding protein